MLLGRPRTNERGQVLVLFALLLPVLFGLGAIVIAIGNWHTHARHLQTKADAAALAGAGMWGFPCGLDTDANIENTARTYVGPHTQADGTTWAGQTFNPQIGGVGEDDIHVVLNGTTWFDDDSNPFPTEKDDPSGSICNSQTLDVKVTESNSFPLFSLIPLFPDIKRKARVEIREVEGITGLLPIAVKTPNPISAAAVFYDESNGNILDVKFFRNVCNPVVTACIGGAPAGLGQWTTGPDPAPSPPEPWASFEPAPSTGVAIALSFLRACSTPGPGPCFDYDVATMGNVNELCNQPGTGPVATQIAQCFFATGDWPNQATQMGLQFIRGFGNDPAGTNTPPQLRQAILTNLSCERNSYFNATPTNACQAELSVGIDIGNLEGDYPVPPGPPPGPLQRLPLRSTDVEVRYRLVRSDGSSSCNYGANCDLHGSGTGPNLTYSTQGNSVSPHLPLTLESGGNAVAIQIRLRNAQNHANLNCRGGNFNNNCRWYYRAGYPPSPSVAPTDAQILSAPIQRSFMGDVDKSGPIKWLRLTQDTNCGGSTGSVLLDPYSASHSTTSAGCFYVDMGLEGGLARDQDEPPLVFNIEDSSQHQLLDCDPNIPQGQIADAIVRGCEPWYAANRFNTNPLCPDQNQFFDLPKAAPFADWPPFRCVKTRPTASGNQLRQGFNERIFGVRNNPSCPADDAQAYVEGRNYWHRLNNQWDGGNFAWDGDTPNDPNDDTGNNLLDDDPRLVNLFFTSYNSFTGSGQGTYPIVGFGTFYITGWGRGGTIHDPCATGSGQEVGAGNLPPPGFNLGNAYYVWGHFVNNVVPSPRATPSDNLCAPVTSFQPCVAILVE